MNPHLQRGLLLFQQGRDDAADAELRLALAEDPDDAYAHALLALSLARRRQLEPATDEARQAVHLAPDFPFAHYALGWVLHDRQRFNEALAAVAEASRLDPSDADYHALTAQIQLDRRDWTAALTAAETGLQMDPEHVTCTNLRAVALVKLGRKAEAGATIDAALRRDPDNAVTHANQGWACLEQNDPKKALEHFRESLRLEPNNEWARAGLVEALKARNIVYGLMLRYFLWMSKLPAGAQFGILFGGYFLNRLLGTAADKNPDLAPWVLPIRVIYLTFALLTWTADPLFNLFLRLNRFGRLALSAEQVRASTWFALVFFPALLSLGLCLVFGFKSVFLLFALVFGFLMVPVSGTFKASEGWPRTVLLTVTLALAGLGFAGLWFTLSGSLAGVEEGRESRGLGGALLGFFVTGCVIFMWGANAIIPVRPKR